MPHRCLAAVAALSLFFLTSCRMDWEPTGPTRTEARSVDLDKSEMVHVELKMGAGELQVRGGSPKLMDGEFTYNRPRWRPEVHYDASGFRGHLTVGQPSGSHSGGGSKYQWALRFNDDEPLDMEVHFGAGEARLDLGSLTLRSLEVHMGVGELRLDLRGTPKRDYEVNIRGGVGEATVYLPEGAGVIADAKGGIGGISAHGLHKR